jgi:hypothetical protein
MQLRKYKGLSRISNRKLWVLAVSLASVMAFPRPAAADTLTWTLHDAVLQYDSGFSFIAHLEGTFTIDSATNALAAYQFNTSTAVFDFGGGSAFFEGAPYPGPEPGASLNPTSGCIGGFCFFGPPVATAGPASLFVGYANLEPQAGFLPAYVVHTLLLDFSGLLTEPGTIDLLGSSHETGNNSFARYAISGYATGVGDGVAVPEPTSLALLGACLIGLLAARRKDWLSPGVRV